MVFSPRAARAAIVSWQERSAPPLKWRGYGARSKA
jgi:hypothetical protein